jgi:hypothetical protein
MEPDMTPEQREEARRHTHSGVIREHEHLDYPAHEHVWITREDANYDRSLAARSGPASGGGLDRERLRAKLHQMANRAAELRPMTYVARGYERACDELLEWLAATEPTDEYGGITNYPTPGDNETRPSDD